MIVIALLLSILRFIMVRKLPVALPLGLAVMFWGICWRILIIEKWKGAASANLNVLMVFSIFIIPICMLAYSHDTGLCENWKIYIFTYIASILLFITMTTYLKISTKITNYIGAVSFSIYLFGPIGEIISEYIFKFINFNSYPHFIIISGIVITICISSITYHYIERPAIMLGKKLIRT